MESAAVARLRGPAWGRKKQAGRLTGPLAGKFPFLFLFVFQNPFQREIQIQSK
jgi:hypothetical protein